MVEKEKQVHSTRIKPHAFLKTGILQAPWLNPNFYVVNTPQELQLQPNTI